jgi:glutathione S-transferase
VPLKAALQRMYTFEKLPVFILEDSSSVYEPHYILEYIETKFPDRIPSLSQDIHSKFVPQESRSGCRTGGRDV